MILNCSKISKTFISEPVISDVSFHLEDHEKAAIVGINGAGKSTLLKIITGEYEASSGSVNISSNTTVGYLSQIETVSSENTIYEEVISSKAYLNDIWAEMKVLEKDMKVLSGKELEACMEKYSLLDQKYTNENGYSLSSEVTGALKGLGFSENDFNRKISTLSGGQKTRVALAALLLKSPDLLILDEPTNHLDIAAVTFLENFLKSYPGAVLVVAHDRYFLDKFVTKVIEISQGHCNVYLGNYTEYAKKAADRRKELLNAYLKQTDMIAHQEAVVKKLQQFNREKSIKRAESRQKMLDKVERLEKPTELNDKMKIKITPSIESGNDVLSVSGLSKAFDDNLLFNDLNFEIKRGEKIALIGRNGTGKTTLLKIINKLLPADNGRITLGAKVHIGYYDQDHQVLHPEKTLFDEISDAYPDLNNTKIRSTLAAFLFTGDDVFKLIKDLSGGERGRVSLAKLMLSNANFLILDEPTNHLDITSKEILEDALNDYEGTVFFVSHDRYFVNRTCTKIFDLSNKNITTYVGNYDYYIEKSSQISNPILTNSSRPESSTTSNNGADDYKASKAIAAQRRKIENRLKRIEDEIEECENRISEIETEMSNPDIATNSAKLTELSNEATALNQKCEELMEEWENLSTQE